MRSRIAVAILAAFLLASPLLAEAPAAHPNAFIVSTVDSQGIVIDELSASDLEVQVGGRAVPVRGLTRYHDAPIRIMIVLDESSSMAARWHVALAIVLDLLQSLPKNASVALVGVNDKTPELIEGPKAIVRYLNSRAREGPGGWTRLWDDIHVAYAALQQPRPTDVIFVVSDGVDTASKMGYRALRDEVRASGVRVSGAILTEAFLPQPFIERGHVVPAPARDEDLLELVDMSGGWNLTSEPFLHTPGEDGRIETRHSAVPNYRAFFRTLYDFYLVDLGEAAVERGAPLRVRLGGTHKEREPVFVSAPERLESSPATSNP